MQDGGRSGCVLHPGDQPTAQTRDQMIDMLRAGGFAAAAVALVAATTFADPSQASKIDMAPAVDALTEHAAATIDAGGLAAGNHVDRFIADFVNATGRIPEADRGSQAWRKAVAISRIALDEAADRVPADVLWYHADYVSPSWGRRLNEFDKIGVHIFYS